MLINVDTALRMWKTGRMVSVIPTARMRARAEIRAEIISEARRQLAVEGAPALSLRAVTRQLGMASSAAYRYFPSRDELLTALIVEAYDALGDAAERAAATAGGSFVRWQTVCRVIRAWAIEHPHEYALIYGSPVPGYRAPSLTVGAASRVTLVLAGLLVDAYRVGEIAASERPVLSRAMAAEARNVAQLAMPDVPLPVVATSLLVWTQLFGQISFELFGQFVGVVEDPEVLFEHAITVSAEQLGLRPDGEVEQ
jgi:AcrR family transcriptional regulator